MPTGNFVINTENKGKKRKLAAIQFLQTVFASIHIAAIYAIIASPILNHNCRLYTLSQL